jgi:hypothetical protein
VRATATPQGCAWIMVPGFYSIALDVGSPTADGGTTDAPPGRLG